MVVSARSGEGVYQSGNRCYASKEQHCRAQPSSVEETVEPATGDRSGHDRRGETHTEQHLVETNLVRDTESGQRQQSPERE
jgi:hypothetical protein